MQQAKRPEQPTDRGLCQHKLERHRYVLTQTGNGPSLVGGAGR
jgi:hypothetical protein